MSLTQQVREFLEGRRGKDILTENQEAFLADPDAEVRVVPTGDAKLERGPTVPGYTTWRTRQRVVLVDTKQRELLPADLPHYNYRDQD